MTARVMGDPVARVATVSILALLVTCVGASLGPLPAVVLGGLALVAIFSVTWLTTRWLKRTGTPPETPTTRVLAERADRRTT